MDRGKKVRRLGGGGRWEHAHQREVKTVRLLVGFEGYQWIQGKGRDSGGKKGRDFMGNERFV